MADGATYPAEFQEPDGSTRIGGKIHFTDSDNQPTGAGSSPDADGDTNPITIKTGDSADGDAGDITIEGGAAPDGEGGSVIIKPGDGDDTGDVVFQAADGSPAVTIHGSDGGATFERAIVAPGLQIDGTSVGTDFHVGTTAWDILNVSGGAIMQWQDKGMGVPGLGFYGTPAIAQPVVPLTTPLPQDIIDALLALGLVSQSD